MKTKCFLRRQTEKLNRIIGLLQVLGKLKINRKNINITKDAINSSKKVIVVGAGPSCKNIDFENIQNAVVILINHAIDLEALVPKNNEVFWFTADAERARECFPKVPSRVKPIVAVHNYASFKSMTAFPKNVGVFFVPLPDCRSFFLNGNVSARQISPGDKVPIYAGFPHGFIPYVLGGTSFLPLLYIILFLGAKVVQIYGVDLDNFDVKYDARVDIPDGAKKNYGFNVQKIDAAARRIIESARQNGNSFYIESHGIFKIPV